MQLLNRILLLLMLFVSSSLFSQEMFDDFNYENSSDEALYTINKWIVVDGEDGPPSGAIYSSSNITFYEDPDNSDNTIMGVATLATGVSSETTHGRIETEEMSYLYGTYAAYVYFDDTPADYGDGNVETFYSISSYSTCTQASLYSEVDFEYLPYDLWGNLDKTMYLTTWETCESGDRAYNAINQSYEGWHVLLYTCSEGASVNYYIDGEEVANLSGYSPDANQNISFANWIIDNNVGTSSTERATTMQVDWVYYAQDETIDYDEVLQRVDSFRNNGIVRKNLDDEEVVIETSDEGVSGLGGTYYLQNRKSGLVMDVYNGGTDDGINILQYTNNETTNQQFLLSEISTGIYTITNVNSGKVIDVAGNSTLNNANIQQWTNNECDCQHFKAISTGDGYYKFKAMHSDKIIEVVNGSTEVNANVSQFTDNDQICGQWLLLPVENLEDQIFIEAEDFTNSGGIDVEDCSEGGENVGYIDDEDWLVYAGIEIPYSGTYTVSYRVASESTGGQLSLDHSEGDVELDLIDIPVTGGWQIWTTVTSTITIDTGSYNLGIYAATGGWNINWFSLTYSGVKTAEAESSLEEDSSEIIIYPNPVSDQLYISGLKSNANLAIYSVAGTLIKTENGNSISVKSLKKGTYILHISTDNSLTTKAFVKN